MIEVYYYSLKIKGENTILHFPDSMSRAMFMLSNGFNQQNCSLYPTDKGIATKRLMHPLCNRAVPA